MNDKLTTKIILQILELVEDHNFSFMGLEIHQEYRELLPRDILFLGLYWLEMHDFISRRKNIPKGAKRYFLNEKGHDLLQFLKNQSNQDAPIENCLSTSL
ncbi:DUF3116 family protein [Listeria aquatica]|uniref:DUF3116 family protein n=1 Tax=Listeria aquatica TaxID=1494960 RepID=A0A841ZQ74_9LIST|nr:DUF3116 family protein [Listeria aquatica]MBC1521484.1 DUF3116 family protein [Listeria aquatica]